ncbi:MAG: hypothetical protein LBD14_01150 [Puniceicoccales bacterium]|jgi:hypothetical protein|nr:hypothetical protein [Puniceicoccales bacterium]
MTSSNNPEPTNTNPHSEPAGNPPENPPAEKPPRATSPDGNARARLAEAPLETTHAALPPLSDISNTSVATELGSEITGSSPRRPLPRRGLARGSNTNAGTAAKPSIGVVEDPTASNETITGRFVNGYTPPPAPAGRRDAPAASPDEFVAPVSPRVQRTEAAPGAHNKNTGRHRARNERREERPRGEAPAGTAPTPQDPTTLIRSGNGRQKLIIEPAKIPEQPKESFFSTLKNFFKKLLGGPAAPAAPKKNDGDNSRRERDNNHNANNGYRNGGPRRHRGRHGGNFRHNNNRHGGTPPSYNRDNRHRPHSHGGNNRPAGGGNSESPKG